MAKNIKKNGTSAAVNEDGRIESLTISAFSNGKGARLKTLPLSRLMKLGNRTHKYAADYTGPFTDRDGVTHEDAVKNTVRMVVGECPFGILTMEATTVTGKDGTQLAYIVEPIIYAPEA